MRTTQKQVVTLADIAKKAKVHPRAARSRLRRAKRGEVPAALKGFRWTWKIDDAARVKEYISD